MHTPSVSAPDLHRIRAGLSLSSALSICLIAGFHGSAALAQVGAATGMATTATDAGPATFEADGISIAHLSYTDLMNGGSLPPEPEWLVPRVDAAEILTDAAAARASGAEFVVLSLHWGPEYETAATSRQVDLVDTLLASPDVALLLSAYANADYLIDASGERRPLPQIDAAAVLTVRPDEYRLIPVRLGDDVFNTFKALIEVSTWEHDVSKTVSGKTPVAPIQTETGAI